MIDFFIALGGGVVLLLAIGFFFKGCNKVLDNEEDLQD